MFKSEFAPRFITPFTIVLSLLVGNIILILGTWYYSRDIERETRRIAKLRRKTGKEGGALLTDVIVN